jgi:predicted transporter
MSFGLISLTNLEKSRNIMTEMEVFWLLKLDAIYAVLLIFATLLFITAATFIIWKICSICDEDCTKPPRFFTLLFTILAIIFMASAVLIPTTEQMVKIRVIPILLSNKNVDKLKQIPTKILDLVGVSVEKLTTALSNK